MKNLTLELNKELEKLPIGDLSYILYYFFNNKVISSRNKDLKVNASLFEETLMRALIISMLDTIPEDDLDNTLKEAHTFMINLMNNFKEARKLSNPVK